ncbi:MAG UNVERIFIED_CONTAM: hypothetical protein LVQ98_01695 [Rickettsiaceae bacterium]|jgi:hypothetical protein
MADNISNDLKKYTSLQIANYVDEQTKGLFVTRPMTILLKRGIEKYMYRSFWRKI